jgi:L-gulonolactone oxidase
VPVFRNWARTHRCTPNEIARPESEPAVAEIIGRATEHGQRVRAVGGAHSWSDVAMSNDVLVTLDGMQRVLEIDRAAATVRVQAGIRLSQLNDALEREGWAIPILGSVSAQSVAGVTATGTHGSSTRYGNLATLITAMRIVTADGSILQLDASDPRLDAARVSLGAFGVVTEITLRIVPAFRLRETLTLLPWQEGLAQLDALAHAHEFFKVWWLPHTDQLACFACDRTEDSRDLGTVGPWLDDKVVNRWVFPGLLALTRAAPATIPAINAIVRRANLSPRTRVGRSAEIFNLAMPPRHRETEWAMASEHAAEAMRRMKAVISDGDLRVCFIQELRWVKGDDAWLSPASGRDTIQLGAYSGYGRDAERFMRGFGERVQPLGARPHWGKEMPPLSPERVDGWYEHAPRWRSLVHELDPRGTFSNARMDQIVGVRT